MTKSFKDILTELCPLSETQYFWSAYTPETKQRSLKSGMIMDISRDGEGITAGVWTVRRNEGAAFVTIIDFNIEGEVDSFVEMLMCAKGDRHAPVGKDRYLKGSVAMREGTQNLEEADTKVAKIFKIFCGHGVEMDVGDCNHPVNKGWCQERRSF